MTFSPGILIFYIRNIGFCNILRVRTGKPANFGRTDPYVFDLQRNMYLFSIEELLQH